MDSLHGISNVVIVDVGGLAMCVSNKQHDAHRLSLLEFENEIVSLLCVNG